MSEPILKIQTMLVSYKNDDDLKLILSQLMEDILLESKKHSDLGYLLGDILAVVNKQHDGVHLERMVYDGPPRK